MTEAELIRDLSVAIVMALKRVATSLEVSGQGCEEVVVAIRRVE